MSLMQFLTVGRSFGGAKEGPNKYRVNEQCLLPKFGKPNPAFRTTTPTVVSEGSMAQSRIELGETGSLFDLKRALPTGNEGARVARSSRIGGIGVMAPVKPVFATLFGESSTPDVSAKPKKATAERSSRKTAVAQPELPVTPAPNPFASPSAPALVTEPSVVPPPRKKWKWLLEGVLYTRRKNVSTRRSPVQGEWSLGRVTVVRNDLSDADLEVVPTGSARCEFPRRPMADPASQDRPFTGLSGRWIGWLFPISRVRF